MRTRLTLLVLMAVLAAAGCSVEIGAQGGDGATGTFERTLAVTGPVELDVRTGAGSVDVRRGDGREVHVVGRIRAHRGFLGLGGGGDPEERVREIEANPPIAQDGNRIRLGPTDGRELRNVSISYELVVPANTNLRAHTGSGRIEVQSVDGWVNAETGSGSLTLGRITGAVVAETGSGSIEVLGAGEGLTARTGSGSIRAQELAGPVRAESGSGRIEVSYAGAGDGDLSTGSGSVVVDGIQGALRVRTGSGGVSVAGEPVGGWDVEAGSGGITLRLPVDAAFELDARSGSGSIRNSHPMTTTSGRSERNRLQGQVRGGGARVLLSTGSGSIRID